MNPEQRYHEFIAHCHKCARCNRAEGEWATPEELCGIGRDLQKLWEMAEIAYAIGDAQPFTVDLKDIPFPI